MACLIFLNFLFIESVEIFAAYAFSHCLVFFATVLRTFESRNASPYKYVSYRADIPHLSNSNSNSNSNFQSSYKRLLRRLASLIFCAYTNSKLKLGLVGNGAQVFAKLNLPKLRKYY